MKMKTNQTNQKMVAWACICNGVKLIVHARTKEDATRQAARLLFVPRGYEIAVGRHFGN